MSPRRRPAPKPLRQLPIAAFRLRILSKAQSSLTEAGIRSPAAALTISSRRRSWSSKRLPRSREDSARGISRFWPGQRSPGAAKFRRLLRLRPDRATGEPLLFKGDDFVRTDIAPAL